MSPLNSAQLAQYQDDGFLVIPEFLSATKLDEVRQRMAHFIDDIVPTMKREEVFYEDVNDPQTLKQLQNMGTHDSYFGEMFTSGALVDLAHQLLNDEVVPKNIQYFCKPPGVGRATPPHQDGYYFMLEPCLAITMWLALDDIDEENGCVRYVRGSHRRGLRHHARTETLGFSQGIVDFPTEADRRDEFVARAAAGDLIVHHAMTIHRADANHSATRLRRALGLVYFGATAKVDKQRHEDYQRQLREEMTKAGKI